MCSLLVISCIALNAMHQTASRLTWSFARDEALFFSNRLGKIHSSLGVPVLALLLNAILVGLVGIIYIFSTTGPPPSPLVSWHLLIQCKQLSTPLSAPM